MYDSLGTPLNAKRQSLGRDFGLPTPVPNKCKGKPKQVVRDGAYDCIDNIGEHDVNHVLGTHLRNITSVEAEPWSALREGTEPIHSDTTTKSTPTHLTRSSKFALEKSELYW